MSETFGGYTLEQIEKTYADSALMTDMISALRQARAKLAEFESVEPLPEMVKCSTFTDTARQERDMVWVGKDLWKRVRQERAAALELVAKLKERACQCDAMIGSTCKVCDGSTDIGREAREVIASEKTDEALLEAHRLACEAEIKVALALAAAVVLGVEVPHVDGR